MGITINDTLVLDVGISQASTYSSFGSASVRSVPQSGGTTDYQLNGVAGIWISQSVRDSGGPQLQQVSVSFGITKGELTNTNIYTLLYDNLKTNYSSTTDVLE